MTDADSEEYQTYIVAAIDAIDGALDGTDGDAAQTKCIESLSKVFAQITDAGKPAGYALSVIFSAGFILGGSADDECGECEACGVIADFEANPEWNAGEC